jgi:hypothetical protein
VTCAVWVPEVHVGTVETMSPVIGLEVCLQSICCMYRSAVSLCLRGCTLQRVNARRIALSCRVCRSSKGAVIQCSKFSCGYSAHVECARLACLELVFEDDPKAGPGASQRGDGGGTGHARTGAVCT